MLVEYLAIVNATAAILFIYDKIAAGLKTSRLPEYFLHLMELAGGVFLIFPLIFIIRHKNKKISYHIITVAILFFWVLAIKYFLTENQNQFH